MNDNFKTGMENSAFLYFIADQKYLGLHSCSDFCSKCPSFGTTDFIYNLGCSEEV